MLALLLQLLVVALQKLYLFHQLLLLLAKLLYQQFQAFVFTLHTLSLPGAILRGLLSAGQLLGKVLYFFLQLSVLVFKLGSLYLQQVRHTSIVGVPLTRAHLRRTPFSARTTIAALGSL